MKQPIFTSIKIFIVLFFVISITENQAAELTINIYDCREPSKFEFLSSLKILKNGKKFKTIKPEQGKQTVLKGLDIGSYTLEYKSIFDKIVNLKVEIVENKKYTTNLCVNFLDYNKEKYIPIIDKLQENEFYNVITRSRGCFHSSKDTLTIKRNKNIYTLTYGTKSKKLSSKDIDEIRHFELELNYMIDKGFCTTTDTYVVNYNGITKQVDDGSCDWHGFDYLTKQLFGTN